MDLNALNNSKFLAKGDVGEAGRVLTIAGFGFETLKDGEPPKLVVKFIEGGKPLVCNKTNRNRLIAAMGTSNTDQMIGRKIEVFFDPMVEYGGQLVGGLRIRPHQAAAEAARAPINPATGLPYTPAAQAAREAVRGGPGRERGDEPPNAPPFDDNIPF